MLTSDERRELSVNFSVIDKIRMRNTAGVGESLISLFLKTVSDAGNGEVKLEIF